MKDLFTFIRCLFIIIILTQVNSSASAQQNKFSGFYIDTHGDTTKGSFPKYRQWSNNPEQVLFRTQHGAEIMLTPPVCQQFHVDGYETYIAYQGKRMTNPIEFQHSGTDDSLDRYDIITCFLREFAASEGNKFYIFKDSNRFNLYYSTNKGAIVELLKKNYISQNHFFQSGLYKEQLQSLFPERSKEISTLLYSETSLTAFVLRGKQDIATVNRKQADNEGFYISGGASINSLKFTPDASLDFSKKSYASDPVPLLSIGYIFPFKRNFSRVFFLPQIKISSLKHTSQATNNDASPVQSTTFKSSPVISLGFHFGYNIINHPDLQVSVAPGAGLNFLTEFRQIDKTKITSTNSSSVVKGMEELKMLIDLQATVIIKKRYVIWSAYHPATHITIYPTTKDKFTSTQFGVGYKFR